MEEHVDVRDWLETIETLVDACVMIIARVLFPRWSCLDHVRHEMTFCGRFSFQRPLPGNSAAYLHLSPFFFSKDNSSFIHVRAFSLNED